MPLFIKQAISKPFIDPLHFEMPEPIMMIDDLVVASFSLRSRALSGSRLPARAKSSRLRDSIDAVFKCERDRSNLDILA